MAITTYDTLQDAVGRRIDPGGSIYGSSGSSSTTTEEWIALAEARLNREFQDRQMETRATASISSEYSSVPSNFGGIRRVLIQGSPDVVVKYVTPQQYDREVNSTQSSKPKVFTIEGDEFRWGPAPDTTYTAEIIYYTNLQGVALSDSNTSNWLLTDHPDCYLYATLAEAYQDLEYSSDDILKVEMRLKDCIDKIQSDSQRERYPSPMVAQSGIVGP